MGTANVATVREFFAVMQKEGADQAALRFCAPNLVWWTPGVGEIQNMLPVMAALIAKHFDDDGITLTIDGITDGGDRIAVEARSSGTLRNGAQYANTYHWLFVFEGDKIATVKEYNDTAHLNAVLGALLSA